MPSALGNPNDTIPIDTMNDGNILLFFSLQYWQTTGAAQQHLGSLIKNFPPYMTYALFPYFRSCPYQVQR